jgi:hypothetical protein
VLDHRRHSSQERPRVRQADSIQQLRQVRHDYIGARTRKGVAAPFSVYSDDEAEAAGAARLHTSEGVFYDHGTGRANAEQAGRFEECIRRGFSRQAELTGDQAIHPHLEQIEDAYGQ